MTRGGSVLTAAAIGALLALSGGTGDAHKPITSPYTFNEDVFPIVQARCAGCHAPGGVAPMSLLTHGDAVPWGESIRAELMAGHMPPWGLDSAAHRFRNVQGLTARELNVLLTWASGGTPAGDPERTPGAAAGERSWPLGTPDTVLMLPEVTLPEEASERLEEFTLATGSSGTRWLRAVDLRPGTAAIVRGAEVAVSAAGSPDTQLLALWLPGDHPVALDPGFGFRLPEGSELVVRVRYRKTWEYERRAMSDRSAVGLYFADEPVADVRSMTLGGSGTVLSEPLRAVAIHAAPATGAASVTVTVTRPNGSRDELIAFRPRAGWARRYWFREPVPLPRGTRIQVEATPSDDRLLPPGALPPPEAPADRAPLRLGLDVVPAG